jgi:CHAD domain-containing protein
LDLVYSARRDPPPRHKMDGMGHRLRRKANLGGQREAPAPPRIDDGVKVRKVTTQALSELRAANQLLSCQGKPSDEAIHRARLHIKKTRAVLRLLPASARAKWYRDIKLALRRANKILRTSRDGTVARETLESIARRVPAWHTAIRAVKQSWEQHEIARHPPPKLDDYRLARADLERAALLIRQESSRQWPQKKLLSAVTRSYRKAYHCYRHAVRTDSTRAWHECRKSTKCLYYQMLFMGLSRSCRETLQQSHLLESTLGKQRDLALLAKAIGHLGAGSTADGSEILLHLHQRRRHLRRHVSDYAASLFRNKPSKFARQLLGPGDASGPI